MVCKRKESLAAVFNPAKGCISHDEGVPVLHGVFKQLYNFLVKNRDLFENDGLDICKAETAEVGGWEYGVVPVKDNDGLMLLG